MNKTCTSPSQTESLPEQRTVSGHIVPPQPRSFLKIIAAGRGYINNIPGKVPMLRSWLTQIGLHVFSGFFIIVLKREKEHEVGWMGRGRGPRRKWEMGNNMIKIYRSNSQLN